jgi:hypothetical protein
MLRGAGVTWVGASGPGIARVAAQTSDMAWVG